MLHALMFITLCYGALHGSDLEYISICGDKPVPFGADSTELLAVLRSTSLNRINEMIDSTGTVVIYEYQDGHNVRHYRTLMGKFFSQDIIYYPTDGLDRYRFAKRYETYFRTGAIDSSNNSNYTSYSHSCDDGQLIMTSISSAGIGIRLSVISGTVYDNLYEGD